MSTAQVRVGVIGTGWWASAHHLPTLLAHPGADVVALADADGERVRAAGTHFGVDRVFDDYRDLLALADLDAVVIAVPHALHAVVADAALRAGRHVLIEKPMTLRARDAWSLVALAQARGLHVAVGYTLNHTPHARRAHELIASGALGELRLVSGLFTSSVARLFSAGGVASRAARGYPPTDPDAETYLEPGLSGGGLGQSQLTHALGLIFGLTGLRATTVSALTAGFDLDVDMADAAAFGLSSGALGSLGALGSMSENQRCPREIRYFGTDGFLVQDLDRGELGWYRNDGTLDVLPALAPGEIIPKQAPVNAFVDTVANDAPNPVPGELGAACVEFLEALYTSAAEGRPVTVSELA